MKLLVISQSLMLRPYQARWRRMAKAYPGMRIRLLVPQRWSVRNAGKEIVHCGKQEDDGNFEVRTVGLTSERHTWSYLVKNFRREMQDFAPDVIFPVHENWQLGQTILWRWLFAPHARLLFFTMNVHPRSTRLGFDRRPHRMFFKLISWVSWRLVRRGTDAAMCHYPDIERQMRKDGYHQPVLIQTQVGVNEEVFHPDAAARAAVCAELGVDGFVVGFTGRVTADKGILDIAAAMAHLPPDVRLLVVGDGPDRARLEETAVSAGWRDRLHLVGWISHSDVHRLMRAMDCFVLGSRTTPSWTDTFPLVVAQAMATGLPVVGSDSGAIPFQLGGKGLVFHEGEAHAAAAHILRLHGDPGLRERMGRELLGRARAEFCIGGMNSKLIEFLNSLRSLSTKGRSKLDRQIFV